MKCEKYTRIIVNFIKPQKKKFSFGGEQKSGCSGQCENCPKANKNNG